jgi:serine phosphatase RsbU (regulator of sigma subunit)
VKGARILVVDDQRGMLRAVQRVLEGRHQVLVFTSPREALASAAAARPDLAILDIRIPEMDGFALLSRLKAAQPDLDVILMTGSATDLDQKMIRAVREEAFYFIQKPFDADLLKALVDRCLQLRALREENRSHLRRLQEELSDARAFQQSLLPPPEAEIEGARVSCRDLPCTELAGDIYDYASCGGGRAALLIADVSGHGAPAAMLTSLVKSAFHAELSMGHEPERVAAAIASALRPFGAERYITMICACLEPGSRSIVYVNAGHPPGLLWTEPRSIRSLAPTGPILSPVLVGATWKSERAPLPPGSRLLLYTDGVTEASSETDFFGEERLVEVIARRPEGGASLLDEILASLDRFRGGRPATDDLTLMAVVVP